MMISDGGYLSWIYGVDNFGHTNWMAGAKKKFSRSNGCLLLVDSRKSFRKLFYADYKIKRKEKRLDDPEKERKYQNVHRFIDDFILTDPCLATYQSDGLEADDLVSIVVHSQLVPLPVRIFGIDKDLLQLPRGTCILEQNQGTRATIEKFAQKQPVALQRLIKQPAHILLTLCLMGDKSDSIPRLIPQYHLDIMQEILQSDRPFNQAYDCFGDEFLRNLYIAILPSPWCFDPVPDPIETLGLLSMGEWNSLPVNKQIVAEISEVIETLPKEQEDDDNW